VIPEKTIPRTQYKTSHTGYQRKQYHEHSIKHPTRDTRENNTTNTVYNIPHGIPEKTIPRIQYKTSHTGYQRKQYHEHSIKHPTRDTKQNNTDAKKTVP
jgi:hypothetical protein